MIFLIFVAFFLIHNSSAQFPPQVTARNHQLGQNYQESDLSLNAYRSELNAMKLQLGRVESLTNQVFIAVKAHRKDVEEVKYGLNKVQGEA